MWHRFGVSRSWLKLQGPIVGKRCGATENIGPAARAECGTRTGCEIPCHSRAMPNRPSRGQIECRSERKLLVAGLQQISREARIELIQFERSFIIQPQGWVLFFFLEQPTADQNINSTLNP